MGSRHEFTALITGQENYEKKKQMQKYLPIL